MPPEPLPFGGNDFLKEDKSFSLEPVGIVPTTPSYGGSSSSFRRGGGGGFRRLFSGHCKAVSGGPHNSQENNTNRSSMSVALKDPRGGNSTTSPNGNSHPFFVSVNSSEQLELNVQPAKNNGGKVSGVTGSSQRLEKENSIGTSLDWKPLKWTRVSSRGSDTKIESQLHNNNTLAVQSLLVEAVTPRNLADEVGSRKKPRLGWGEGLAKYEKKKVGSDDGFDKECSSEPLLSSPCNLLTDKSGFLECASPTTPCSLACRSSPGIEEKAATLDNTTYVASCQNDTFNLEMDKLRVWKADILKKLEITETEIDSLENELKSFISDPFPLAVAASTTSIPNNQNTQKPRFGVKINPSKSQDLEKDGQDFDIESPGTVTSKLVEEPLETVFVSRKEDKKLYEMILDSNKVIANQASDELAKMLPVIHLCTDISKATVMDESLVKKKIAARKRFMRFKERVITLKFCAFWYPWKDDLRLFSVRRFRAKSLQKKFEFGFSVRSRLSSVDYMKKMLLGDPTVRIQRRNSLKMPCFILDKRERMGSRFISDNGLVENPIDVEKERSFMNPWTTQEKEIFMEKYSLYGKNLRKISTFLEHKTVADCVEFYYKNHKSNGFQKTKKKNLQGIKSHATNNTYLITSGKRSNQDIEICKEQQEKETAAAANVLAGICGPVSSEGLSSSITSSIPSPASCGHLVEPGYGDWTDEERLGFLEGVKLYSKDFEMVSRYVGTRSEEECRVFFGKTRKRLGLDEMPGGDHRFEGVVSEDDEEDEDGFIVESGRSVISNEKSSFMEEDGESESGKKGHNLDLVLSYENEAESKLKLDESGSRNGDFKLFGKILASSSTDGFGKHNGNGLLDVDRKKYVVPLKLHQEGSSSYNPVRMHHYAKVESNGESWLL